MTQKPQSWREKFIEIDGSLPSKTQLKMLTFIDNLIQEAVGAAREEAVRGERERCVVIIEDKLWSGVPYESVEVLKEIQKKLLNQP